LDKTEKGVEKEGLVEGEEGPIPVTPQERLDEWGEVE